VSDCTPKKLPARRGPRVSSLPLLAKCPGFRLCEDAATEPKPDAVVRAGHTGTATGRVLELWHRFGGDTGLPGAAAEALERAMQTCREENDPNTACADWDRVTHYGLLYAQDIRNRRPSCHEYYGEVVADLQEAEVKLTLDADPDDPSDEPIELVGHVDQIRRDEFGHLRVWDVKCGRPDGDAMTRDYALQLAAYALACTETWGETVLPGGIIRMRGYDLKGRGGGYSSGEHPVFYPVTGSLEACRTLLGTVAYVVGEFARGIVRTQPGDQCRYCPGGGPFECYRLVDEALANGALS
jgi:hypothetical protein